MIRAGFIGAGLGFVYIMSLTMVSPFCSLCFTPFFGVGVGYASGWFDKPSSAEISAGKGGVAGGIAGLGIIAGQISATVVNGILFTNSKQLSSLLAELGLGELIINDVEYWQATLTLNSFCSIFNLALMVGLAAAGSMLWFRRQHNRVVAAVSSRHSG